MLRSPKTKMADEANFSNSWETEEQHKARLQFVNTWKEDFETGRLAGLSMVWLNMKFLGCRYPSEVENLVMNLERKAPISVPNRSNNIVFKKAQIIENLVIYEPPNDDASRNAISILSESCQKSKKNLSFEELLLKSGQYRFAVIIENKLIANGEASNKKDAKKVAAEKALEELKPCQRVLYKRKIDHEAATTVSRNKLTKKAYEQAPSIPESNVGNQLLRKMGWKGVGGVGKSGQGIAEPIMVLEAEGKKGLGTMQPENLHHGSIKKVLMDFLSSKDTDLKFSSELTKEDRAEVHRLCRIYGLKHRSHGGGEDRYLVVSKKES